MRQQRSYTNHHVCFGTVLKGMRVVREIGELGTKVGKTQHRDAPFIFFWDLNGMGGVGWTSNNANKIYYTFREYMPTTCFCSMSRNNIFLRSKGVDESGEFVNKRTGDVAPTGCSYNNVPCLCDMCIKKHIYIYIMNTCIHPFISISYTNCSSYCTLNLLQRRVSIDSATIRILKRGQRVRRRSVVYEHMHIHAQKFQHFFGGSWF